MSNLVGNPEDRFRVRAHIMTEPRQVFNCICHIKSTNNHLQKGGRFVVKRVNFLSLEKSGISP